MLDARQGKVLDEKIKQTSDNLSKMIQASGYLGVNANWNNYTSAGVYKVQNATMTAEYHAPVGLYNYGTLLVFLPEIGVEDRKVHIYIPDGGVSIAIRGYNHAVGSPISDSNWHSWFKISGQLI